MQHLDATSEKQPRLLRTRTKKFDSHSSARMTAQIESEECIHMT